jgi:PhnB protein
VRLSPYLHFNGNCEAAFKFYEKCLGGKIQGMFAYEGTPGAEQVSANWRSKIMHACLIIGDQALMGSDSPPPHYQKPQGFSVTLSPRDPAEADRLFQALSENGTIKMPLQKTFWAERFGMFTDRFGVPWMINCGPSA